MIQSSYGEFLMDVTLPALIESQFISFLARAPDLGDLSMVTNFIYFHVGCGSERVFGRPRARIGAALDGERVGRFR